MKTIVNRTQCPQCLDSSRDNLVNYSDGGSYCYACGFFVSDGNKTTQVNPTRDSLMSDVTLESVLKKRGISLSTAKRYGVTLVENDGEVKVRVPITDANGAETGAQYREVDTSSGTLTREMRTTKGSKLKVPYFGVNTITKLTETIVVCEGWTDALIAASALEGRVDVSVLGICGATFAKRAAAFSAKYHQDKTVVLAFDNDEAGEQARQVFCQTIAQHLPDKKLRKLPIPAKHKDLGDWITKDAPDLLTFVLDAPAIYNSNILTSEDVGDKLVEFLGKLRQEKYINLSFSPTLNSAVKLMPGKLVGIIGDSGQGKSTLAEHLMLECITQKHRVFCLSAEMSSEEVALKLMRVIRNEPLHSVDYLKSLSDDDIAEVSDQTKQVLKWLTMVDNFGVCDISTLDEYLLELTASGNKPSVVVVDHLLAISKSLEPNELQKTCQALKALARWHQVCVVLLSHIKKPQNQNRRTVYRPTISDPYGSQGLTMYADVVVAVAKDPVKRLTFVETVKQERLVGEYADVTLAFQDWQLVETENKGDDKPVYETDVDETEDSDVY